MHIFELLSEAEFDSESQRYVIDLSTFDIMDYSLEVRLKIYDAYCKCEQFRDAVPFHVYLSWLNNEPCFAYIPEEYLSVDLYNANVIISELDPNTNTIAAMPNNYHVLRFPTVWVGFPILKKFLAKDYLRYEHNLTLSSPRTQVYYDNVPYYDVDVEVHCINGFNDCSGPYSIFTCSTVSDLVRCIEDGCDVNHAVMKYFNPKDTRPPRILSILMGAKRSFRPLITVRWARRQLSYIKAAMRKVEQHTHRQDIDRRIRGVRTAMLPIHAMLCIDVHDPT